jgi:hypothetical protein
MSIPVKEGPVQPEHKLAKRALAFYDQMVVDSEDYQGRRAYVGNRYNALDKLGFKREWVGILTSILIHADAIEQEGRLLFFIKEPRPTLDQMIAAQKSATQNKGGTRDMRGQALVLLEERVSWLEQVLDSQGKALQRMMRLLGEIRGREYDAD